MLKLHEVLGTDKVILAEKENNLFSLRDLLALGEKTSDYELVGYVRILKWGEMLFEPVYLIK